VISHKSQIDSSEVKKMFSLQDLVSQATKSIVSSRRVNHIAIGLYWPVRTNDSETCTSTWNKIKSRRSAISIKSATTIRSNGASWWTGR